MTTCEHAGGHAGVITVPGGARCAAGGFRRFRAGPARFLALHFRRLTIWGEATQGGASIEDGARPIATEETLQAKYALLKPHLKGPIRRLWPKTSKRLFHKSPFSISAG